ncbi:hypothetical protein GMORB2_7157 [Geosmithia morbida]|uniref:Uncharacterized protein n=1 Tax=Geosmithia morbida TaxID=1094350 RepID=A0A9P4YU45_9HYPO|nr:uncharacterized protein GMORB2_7157 [Geosmithia morbida]KAF4122850.1 hypothetical protein GMORB2_7157 [Geosmithia morbida]
MLLLRNSFSQKRKDAKRPRDLHIRKVSFSGSSLSCCSLSSSDSTASACTTLRSPPTSPSQNHRSTSGSSNGGHLAPPRLHERPLKTSIPRRAAFAPAVYDDDIDADYDDFYYPNHLENGHEDRSDVVVLPEPYSEEEESDDGDDGMSISDFVMAMPPPATAPAQPTDDDYFTFRHMAMAASVASARPPVPCSRWSASTIDSISTVGSSQEEHDDDDVVEDAQQQEDDSAPTARRPPMHHMDSVDNFVKRGGWKRRGIVFQREEFAASISSF